MYFFFFNKIIQSNSISLGFRKIIYLCVRERAHVERQRERETETLQDSSLRS